MDLGIREDARTILSEILVDQAQHEDPYDHDDLTNRMKRTLYYDPIKKPDRDTLSFSATESAVSHFRNVAPMSMGKLGHRYASRVARDACISPCALLLGLIYIERLKNKNPKYLENISSSDLFLVSMMVSSKYLFDEGCEDEVFNDEWAISGDMTVDRVNTLEREFLHAMEWRLYVHPHEFSSMLISAERDIALTNGKKRGWMTYSDLLSLLDSRKIYDQLTQAAGIMSAATCFCVVMYSGLVCLTALTSVALISVSNDAPLEQPFGPQPSRDDLVPERNQSDPGSLVNVTFSHLTDVTLTTGTNYLVQRRTRTKMTDFSGAMRLNLQPDDHLVSDMVERMERIPIYRASDSISDEDSQSPKSSQKPVICSMAETLLLMACNLTVCLRNDEANSNHCPNCGKSDSGSEQDFKYNRCHNTETLHTHDSSIRSDPRFGHESFFNHPSQLSLSKKRSMLGIYNPTLPPIRTPLDSMTKFSTSAIAH